MSKCVVRAVEVAPGDTRLAAWMVPVEAPDAGRSRRVRDDVWATLDVEAARRSWSLRRSSLVAALPLTPNGKLDARALAAPVWERERGGW